jgi:hypothetical protein
MSPRWGSTPRRTDWLTVGRNVTLILTIDQLILSASFTMKTVTAMYAETLQVNYDTIYSSL